MKTKEAEGRKERETMIDSQRNVRQKWDERGKRRIKKKTACESHRRQRTSVMRVHICAVRAIYNAAERY